MSAPQLPLTPPSATDSAPKGSNGLAVAGFILGLLGLLGSFIPVVNIGAIIIAVVGLALASVGLVRSKTVRAGKGLAVAGLILGVLAIIIAIIIDAAVGNAVHKATSTTIDTHVKAPGGAKAGSGSQAASNTGHSRSDPAPLGSSISGGGWTVRINSVKTVDVDSMGQSAAPGKTILLINLTARYNGHDSQGDTSFATVKYVAPDGNSFDSTTGGKLLIPNNQFDSLKTTYHGGTETGNEMIQIPAANWQDGVLAVSPGMLSDDTFLALK